jgi:hypothetical protein
LLRKSGNASVGQLPLWDETDLGETIEDAPVGVHRLPRPNLPNRRIRDPYVRWCRRRGVVRHLPILISISEKKLCDT